MLLQRKHQHDRNGLKAPVVSGIRVKRLPENGKQHLSPKLVKTGQSENWLTRTEDKITIHDEDGDVVFNIIRNPGRYCCHCQEKLTDDADGAAARDHVTKKHDGKKSPDPQNPSGYLMINYYDCEFKS